MLEGNEWHPIARRSLAAIALARGDLSLADDQARLCLEAHDPLDPARALVLELMIDVQLAREDLDSARETLSRLQELAIGAESDQLGAIAELAAGRVGAAEGEERAAARLQAALVAFAALGLPLETARARLELARAVATRAADAAIAEARLALSAFEQLGAKRDADTAAELLRGLGAPGRAWPKRYGSLTKRETEVLSLLAAGYSNAQIAERLYISGRTAEHHVASILSKLGLRSRDEVAAYAVRDPPERPVAG